MSDGHPGRDPDLDRAGDLRHPAPRPRPVVAQSAGLQVDLSQIVLDITAISGPGNLLGNLLCAVAELLDSPTGLVRVLNDILGAL
jgi:hypothetical protein